MEKLYQIEEYVTTGWEVLDSSLTREVCSQKLQDYLVEGYNPEYLRVRPSVQS